jgi:hypothetical protein
MQWLALAAEGMHTHPLSQLIDVADSSSEVARLAGLGSDRMPVAVYRAGRCDEEAPVSRRLPAPMI